ncbi:1069_t:CDS:2 [Racocetra fulgida]|uniref:1069_t:CDS:1 n=1 Tax=Racocetra fulgida TaxID=60492 RepID=A0A9N8W7D6_9GLOM|nr:1069_t:CDS:2 [Racocetra fulgida]
MQAAQVFKYDIKDYTDDNKASLKRLFDYFDQFIEFLQESAISPNYLPASAILIEYNRNSKHNRSIEEAEYLVQQFGKITDATYIRRQTEQDNGNVILQTTYKCHCSETYQFIVG